MNAIDTPVEDSRTPSRYSLFSGLLGGFIVLLMLWPIGHGWLVQNYGINPWKGFGIAMYCTRQLVTIEVLRPTNQGFVNFPIEDLMRPGIQEEYIEFTDRRKILGILSGPPPVTLAEKVFALDPTLKDVLFRIRMFRLTANTAELLVDQKCTYHFHREGNRVVLFDQDEKIRLLQN